MVTIKAYMLPFFMLLTQICAMRLQFVTSYKTKSSERALRAFQESPGGPWYRLVKERWQGRAASDTQVRYLQRNYPVDLSERNGWYVGRESTAALVYIHSHGYVANQALARHRNEEVMIQVNRALQDVE